MRLGLWHLGMTELHHTPCSNRWSFLADCFRRLTNQQVEKRHIEFYAPLFSVSWFTLAWRRWSKFFFSFCFFCFFQPYQTHRLHMLYFVTHWFCHPLMSLSPWWCNTNPNFLSWLLWSFMKFCCLSCQNKFWKKKKVYNLGVWIKDKYFITAYSDTKAYI